MLEFVVVTRFFMISSTVTPASMALARSIFRLSTG